MKGPLIAGSLLLLCYLVLYLVPFLGSHGTIDAYGAYDFIQYWSAMRVAIASGNPYDASALLEVQREMPGFTDDRFMFMWNPPWTMTLLAPVVLLPFPYATLVWGALTLVLFVAAGQLVWRSMADRHSFLLAAILPLTTVFPIQNSLEVGQASVISCLGFAGFLWGIITKRFALAGCFTALTTVKPHLFYLPLFIVGWWLVRKRTFRFFGGFAAALALLVIITEAWAPGLTLNWVTRFSVPNEAAIDVRQWVVATIPGAMRDLLADDAGMIELWPSMVIPGLCLSLGVFWLVALEREPNWREVLPGLTILSVMTSPYGWVFDQAVLFIIPIAILAPVYQGTTMFTRSLLWCLLVTALYAPASLLSKCCLHFQHHFFWLPALPATLWLLRRPIRRWLAYAWGCPKRASTLRAARS